MGNPPEGRSRLIAHGQSTTSIAASGTVACLAIEGGEILTVDLRTAETKVIARCEERGAAASMVVDGEHVYALRIGGIGCRLVRAPLDGGGPEETLVDGLAREVAQQWLPRPTGAGRAPAFALHEGHLFWFDASQGDLMRVPASGGTPARVAHVRRGLESIVRMASAMGPVGAVVASDGYVLWTAYHCEELASEPAVTDEASWLAWEAHRRDVRLRAMARLALFRAPTSGGAPEIVVRDFGLATTLAAGGGLVAWSAAVEDGARRTALRCMSVRGGEITELVDTPDAIGHVAAWDGAIYAVVGPHGAEIRCFVPAQGGGATAGRAAPASVTTSDHGHRDVQPRSDRIPFAVVPAGIGVLALAVGAFGVVWKTSWNLFVKAFHDAPGAVDLANRPDDPGAITPEITPEQRALEDEVDAAVRRRPVPEGAAVERVRVTFAAPFASYWRIGYPDCRGRAALVGAAVEPSEAAIEAFRRAVTLDYERIFFNDVTFVHLRGAAPAGAVVVGVGRFEDLDAFRGTPRWSDVSERALRARSADAWKYVPAFHEPLRARWRDDGREVDDARDAITSMLADERGVRAVLFGEAGSGKTFVLREVARALGAREGAPAPLLVDAGFEGRRIFLGQAIPFDALIERHFKQIGISRGDPHEVRRALAERRAVLLLDHADVTLPGGFADAAAALARVCADLPATANVIVTCRRTHLHGLLDEAAALAEIGAPGEAARALDLRSFDRIQIRRALGRRLEEPARDARAALVDGDEDLFALVRHPRLLADLAAMDDVQIEGKEGALRLDALFRRRARCLAPDDARVDDGAALLLAGWLWKHGMEHVDARSLEDVALPLVRDRFRREVPAAATAHCIAHAGTVTRDDDGALSFVHPAFAEWLVARCEAPLVLRQGAFRDMETLVGLLRARPMTARMATFFAAQIEREVGPGVRIASIWARSQIAGGASSPWLRREEERALVAFLDWMRDALRERGASPVLTANVRAVLAALGVDRPPPVTASDLVDGSLRGRSLRNANLRAADLRAADLAGRDLAGAVLESANLEGASLSGANLRGVNAARANLRGADLSGADLACANLSGADLEGAALAGARLIGAKLIGAKLDDGALASCDVFGAALTVPDHLEPTRALAGSVADAAFHPTGLFVATAGSSVRIWDAETGAYLRAIRLKDGVNHVAFSPDGRWLATSYRRVELWDLCTGEAAKVPVAQGGSLGLVWAPDGTAIAAASHYGVWIYDVPSLTERLYLKEQCSGGEIGLAWSAGGARIATCHARRARVWDARTGEELRAILSSDGVEQVALSRDGWTLVTAGEHALVCFWDVATGELVRSYRVSDAWLRGMAFSPDWTKLAIAASGSLVVVDAGTGAELHRFRGSHPRAFDTLSRVAWSPDGAALVATMGNSGGDVPSFVWDLGSSTMRWAVRDRLPRLATFDHRWDGRGRAAQEPGGTPEGALGYSIGLARFELGELDPYLPEPLVVPGDSPLPPASPPRGEDVS